MSAEQTAHPVPAAAQAAALPSAAPPAEADKQPAQAASRSMQLARPSKRRKNVTGRGGGAGDPAPQEELVRLGPEVARTSERLRVGWRPVQLSADDKAPDVQLDAAQLAASSRGGYRMVRATHGAFAGTWYFEVRIDRLGETGAARVGWATRQAELNAPVGADEHGVAYRSAEGSKVHKAWRDGYGEPYGEGDVVGCLLHLPEAGRPFEQAAEDAVQYRGKVYFPEGDPAAPPPLPGAFVAFARNGVLQGKAYEDLTEGTYYPAISLYSNHRLQREAVQATVNLGEQGFAFPPPAVEGCPAPRPVCQLAGPRPAPAHGQQLAAAQQAAQPAADGAADGLQPPQQREAEQLQQHELAEEQQQAGGEAEMAAG